MPLQTPESRAATRRDSWPPTQLCLGLLPAGEKSAPLAPVVTTILTPPTPGIDTAIRADPMSASAAAAAVAAAARKAEPDLIEAADNPLMYFLTPVEDASSAAAGYD